jgi:DNA-binding CsgD family transcriptional regulator
VEVCARIIYGLYAKGIALDLDIGEETVATHRKRAYQKLLIATQRELLLWYIEQWRQISLFSEQILPRQSKRTLIN